MARQPETRDRFKIIAEVESEALGPLLAQLARMGLQNLGYELITDVMSFKARTRDPSQMSATSVLRAWLPDHPTFTRVEALAHLEESGIGKGTAGSALQTLMTNREIIQLERGQYRRADAALPPPAASAATKTKQGRGVRRHPPNKEFLWAEFKGRKKFVPADVSKFFVDAGRDANSASSLLSVLTREGFFTRTEDGVYSPVKDKRLPSAPKSKAGVNGSGAAHHV